LPDAVFSALSTFNWPTWIAPNNINLALIGGQSSGLGLVNPIPTFDWSVVNALNFPLITPLFATINMTVGMLVAGIFFIIPIYWTNTWYSKYLPINSNGVFDRFGNGYNVSMVLDAEYSLDANAYNNYSPAYLTAGNAVVYMWFFAVYTATLVYVGLHHHREVVLGFKSAWNFASGRGAFSDVHNRLMAVYPEVPEWWFGGIFLISFAFGVACIEHYHTAVPVWTIVFGVVLAIIFVVPVGIITAVTNISVTLNVMAELVGGYALPGKPLANMIFKTFGFITTAQAVGYAGDLKLAHYTKLPPRHVFVAQLISSILALFVGLGVVDWQLTNVSNLCEPDQVDKFTCPGYQTFFTAAVIWGTIGPNRLFSHGGLYYATVFGFLVGAVVPVPFWYMARRYPGSFWKLIHMPAFFYGGLNWAPYNFSYLYAGLPYALFFQGYVRRYKMPWWSKYNYILATALQSSVAIFGVIWFFAILYKDYQPVWWGNTVSYAGLDGAGTSLLTPDPVNGFGPGPGEFHA